MDARKPTGKLDPAQLKALLRADMRTTKVSSQALRGLGVIEAGVVHASGEIESADRLRGEAERMSTSVIVSRAYQDQVAESNLEIQRSGEAKTAPIPKVRRAANG